MLYEWVLILHIFVHNGSGNASSSVTVPGFSSESTCNTQAEHSIQITRAASSGAVVSFFCVKTDKRWKD